MTAEPLIYLARQRQRCDTAANWEEEDPELLPGEFGVQFDPEAPEEIQIKLGQGAHWSETPFFSGGGGGGPTNLSYDPATRLLGSSSGSDVTLPLVGTVVAGQPVAGLQTAAEAARLAESGSPTFANLTVSGTAYLSHIHGNIAGLLYHHVRNSSGASLAALTPYRIVDTQGDTDRANIIAARADTASAMPASGILISALGNNGDGHGAVVGELLGVNTTGRTSGESLYVGLAGGLTPTAPSERAQVVAIVGRVHATTGSIIVQIGTVRPTAAEVGADPAGTAAGAITTHLAAATHLTAQQAAAAAPVQSVAGKTGSVTLSAADISGLGTAATTDATAYATAAQGALAASAVQPADLAVYQPRTLEVVDVAYAAVVNIDFSAYNGRLVVVGTLTGNIQFTFSNIAVGKNCAIRLTADSSARNITVPPSAPYFAGSKVVPASKAARLSFECTGTTEASVDIAFALQQ
jgi:hypothetical protein